MSLKDEILKAARKTGGTTLRDIYATSGGKKRSRASIRGAVYKMARRGELEKTPEGKYRLPEEESQEGEDSEVESTGPESGTREPDMKSGTADKSESTPGRKSPRRENPGGRLRKKGVEST